MRAAAIFLSFCVLALIGCSQRGAWQPTQSPGGKLYPPDYCDAKVAIAMTSAFLSDAAYGEADNDWKALKGNGYNWYNWSTRCDDYKVPEAALVGAVGKLIMGKAEAHLPDDANGSAASDFDVGIDYANEIARGSASVATVALAARVVSFAQANRSRMLLATQSSRSAPSITQEPAPVYSAESPSLATAAPPEVPTDAPAEEAPAPLTFHGYVCRQTCQGHERGYEWAEEKGITDPDDCPINPHNSPSFTEGCWAEAGREGPE